MNSSTRLLIIADVGGEETRHLGDEAMLEANLDALRRLIPGVVFTIVSRDPAWVTKRYGVTAVATFGFPHDPSAITERRALLESLLTDAAKGGREEAIIESTVDAVAGTDGLVVSGGGNLSATWPDLLYERVALLNLARIFGKPTVVLGQTIGPMLGDDGRRQLAAALSSARFVGVRELPSAALAFELGVPPERVWYQSDDALFLEESPAPLQMPAPKSGPSIAVTIDPQVRAAGRNLFGSLIAQLRELSKRTGAHLVLIPHVYGNESAASPSDLTEAHLIAEGVGLPQTVVAEGLDARQAKQVTGDAALVISSRYHPIVFGLAAAVPCIGIYGDDYCRIKLEGALAHAQLERWAITYDDVARGRLVTDALELWHTRDELRCELESRRETWRVEFHERWSAVLRAIDPTTILPSANGSTPGGPV
jgi:polysaccharide pyruvyl transferase WcaK-like protein